MSLKGDISSLNLADIFQGLANNQRQGTLVVSDGESTKHIYFREGKVCFIASGKKKGLKLGRILVRRGSVTPRESEIALNRQSRLGGRLGDILVEMGVCTEDDVIEALCFQIRQEIYSLFTWHDATFEFKETVPDEEIFSDERMFTQTSFDVPALLLEAARRADEWDRIQKIIHSMREIYRVVDDASAATTLAMTQKDDEAVVLGLIDGRRDVEQLIIDASIGYFETCDILCQQIASGRIEPVGFDELIRNAEELLASESPERALPFFSRAVEMEPQDLDARFKLTEAYKILDQHAEAGLQLKEIARIYCTQKEMERAADALQQAASLMPKDLDVCDRLYRLRLETGQTDLAVEEGLELAHRLRRTGDLLRKKEIYEALIHLKPTDNGIRKMLINHYLDMGDAEAAVNQYEILAESLMTEGKRERVMEIYKKILTCDPKRHDIRWRLDNLFAGEIRKRKWRRVITISAVSGLLLMLMGAYQYIASVRFDALLLRAQAHVLTDEYDEKIADLKSVVDGFPFTLAAMKAEQTVQALTEHGEAERARLADALQRVDSLDREGRQPEARTMMVDLVSRYNLPILQERLDAMDTAASDAQRLYDQGRAFEALGDTQRAFEAYSQLFYQHGNTPKARQIRLPIRIESDPIGAEVTLNGRRYGRTPVAVSYDPQKSFELELTHPDFEPARVTEIGSWLIRTKMARKVGWHYTTTQPVEGSGIVVDKTYYIGGRDGNVYAFDIETGQPRWTYTGGSVSDVVSGIAIGGGQLYFGSINGTVTALDQKSGRRLWQYRVGTQIRRTPVYVAQLKLVVATEANGVLHALKATTGQKLWQFDTGTAGVAQGTAVGSRYYFGHRSGKLTCYDLSTRQAIWQTDLDGPVHAAPRVVDQLLYIGTGSGTLYALNTLDGAELWKTEALGEIYGTPAVDETQVYVGTGYSTVLSMDRVNGKRHWTFKTSGHPRAAPYLSGTILYIGGADGMFYAIDSRTGRERWSFASGGPIYGTASVYKDKVLFGSGDYKVYALAR